MDDDEGSLLRFSLLYSALFYYYITFCNNNIYIEKLHRKSFIKDRDFHRESISQTLTYHISNPSFRSKIKLMAKFY
jgi:hypothetical protein